MTCNEIHRIPTSDPATFAFEIEGEISAAAMEAMADLMNTAFDDFDTVNMLLIFRDYEGSEGGAGLDWSSIKSRFRALSNVRKYAVVGAPEGATYMVETIGKIIPTEARAFAASDQAAAWTWIGARPI